jgi:hypothetical protein
MSIRNRTKQQAVGFILLRESLTYGLSSDEHVWRRTWVIPVVLTVWGLFKKGRSIGCVLSGIVVSLGARIGAASVLGLAVLTPLLSQAGSDDLLYVQTGTDSAFAEILASGNLLTGRNSNEGVTGSTIHVNQRALEVGPYATRPIPKDIRIHTLGNSVIQRKNFSQWSRWYQEHGNTQVFRLFKGETNVRNDRKLAARVEAFSELKWKRGTWHEWSATYTIIKPHGAAIFQVKNGGAPNWAVQINMNDNGDVILNHRRAMDVVIARNMTGKPFHIHVRDDGHDYEVRLDGKQVGTGSWARPEGETGFRWGIYVGARPVRHDAMVFVTGAAIDPCQPVTSQKKP